MTTFQQRTQPVGLDDLGTGDPALLLLPGWCGDRTVFAPLAQRLAGTRRTLVADLRGQGERRDDTEDFDSAAQLADLVATLEAREVERVVPVALSHAGWFAIGLRRLLGADRVPGVVLLDWMPLGTPPGFTDALAGLQHPDHWDAVRAGLAAMWTDGVDEPAVHDYVASMTSYGFEHWSRAGREIAAGYAEGPPVGVLAEMGGVPTMHLYAQPADPSYLAVQEELARVHPWFSVRHLDARSHFPMLEVPGTMAREIEEFTCSLG